MTEDLDPQTAEGSEPRERLREAAWHAPNAFVREEAIVALSSMRIPEDLPLLLDLLRDPDVQDVAQSCIERDWGDRSTDALIARLAGCDDDCLCLIEALEHVGGARAMKPLTGLIGHHDQTVAEWAARAVAVIGNRSGAHQETLALLRAGQRASRNIYVTETVQQLIDDLSTAT
jgi:HEAT repeat protein